MSSHGNRKEDPSVESEKKVSPTNIQGVDRVRGAAMKNAPMRIKKDSEHAGISESRSLNVSSPMPAPSKPRPDLGAVRSPEQTDEISRGLPPHDRVRTKVDAPESPRDISKAHPDIPSRIADHLPHMKSKAHSSSTFQDRHGLLGIPAGDVGVSGRRLPVPASTGDVHHHLGSSILTSSGSESSLLPQPELDHQGRCEPACVEGSVCLHLKHKSSWECICEGALGPPHPETGCDPLPRGEVSADSLHHIEMVRSLIV